jgi:type IV pilus assembly protein PilO
LTATCPGRSLQFDLFRPGQVAVKEYYAELPIAVRVNGRYHDIGAFVADIAKLPRIVTLSNLNIQPLPQREGVLAMDATAKTFRYLDADEVAAQRLAAAAKAKAAKK